ncbi:MAG TPA: hypothetical protein PKL32_00750, partial [Candidatus Woesebacteria bacterium]|nr:hypothetical protein [Candidatus Woesebacteria bacterium]
EFLEKIINKPVVLPAVDWANINMYCIEKIADLLDSLEIKNDKQLNMAIIAKMFDDELFGILNNLRKAKRFINSIQTTLPTIINEVNLVDVFLMELIKVFYRYTFSDIRNNELYYISYFILTDHEKDEFKFIKN